MAEREELSRQEIERLVSVLRLQKEGPGPICPVNVHQARLVSYEAGENAITTAGHIVLALVAERDQLIAELEEARADLKGVEVDFDALSAKVAPFLHEIACIMSRDEATVTRWFHHGFGGPAR